MLMIMIDGRPLPPEKAIREQLPLDTSLRCPMCNQTNVMASRAKTTERFSGEVKAFIPRKQTRSCLDCGAQWETVLHPAVYNDQITGGSR